MGCLRREIPGQLRLWQDGGVAVVKHFAPVQDASVSDAEFEAVLIEGANLAFKLFKRQIPREMSFADFKQEVIVKVLPRARRFRKSGRKTFRNYVLDTCKLIPLDILRREKKAPPVEFYGEFHKSVEPTEADRMKWRPSGYETETTIGRDEE